MFYLVSFFLSLAALPPLAQEIKELQSILSSKELGERLHSGELIQVITRIEGGYLIITDQTTLQVRVEYLGTENGMAGPQRYQLEFLDASS